MSQFITGPSFELRLRHAISVAWSSFSRKVGGGLVPVNKEASMQLQFAYLLQQVLPLVLHSKDESANLELETGVKTSSGTNNIDILVRGRSKAGEAKIAIEMKCYRTVSASKGPRGATDIFMKDVYEDLHVLEEYVALGVADIGVALVMNDLRRLVLPRVKRGKCWAYDISNGFRFPGGRIDVPVGAKSKTVNVNLNKEYEFKWEQFGEFWFAELEGTIATQSHAQTLSTLPSVSTPGAAH